MAAQFIKFVSLGASGPVKIASKQSRFRDSRVEDPKILVMKKQLIDQMLKPRNN